MFDLVSEYIPRGSQITAIPQIIDNFKHTDKQVLFGVTGSGKTFTMANVISQVNKPTLILAPNKSLVYQLYNEMKQLFPNNLVSYYVSHFDYYLPENYNLTTDTYREKDSAVNDELKRIRLETINNLLRGRTDVIVVSSISCIYGAGNPDNFNLNKISLTTNQEIGYTKLLRNLHDGLYERVFDNLMFGQYLVKGDSIIIKTYSNSIIRITMFGDEIETIEYVNDKFKHISYTDNVVIYPCGITSNPKPIIIDKIKNDLTKQLDYFNSLGMEVEHDRLKSRVEYDISMLEEVGWVSGIENYSKYFDERQPNQRPLCLLDFFSNDFLTIIDESHLFIPQLKTMSNASRSTKLNLIEHGFRLPSALDSRPLNIDEFFSCLIQVLYVSATPGDYELNDCNGVIVEQLIRPTYVVDPPIICENKDYQIDNSLEYINEVLERGGQVILNTITKNQSQNLSKYLNKLNYNSIYLHSEISTLDRITITNKFKNQEVDILIGVNLLREGLDFPNVQLVCIYDCDYDGFLRNEKALTQLAGRAARNPNSKVILYFDKETQNIKDFIKSSQYKRFKQLEYNKQHNIIPTTKSFVKPQKKPVIDDSITVEYAKKQMLFYSNKQEYIEAAYWRDIYLELKSQ